MTHGRADRGHEDALPAHLAHRGRGAGAVRAGLGLAVAAPPRAGARAHRGARPASASAPGPSCCSARCRPPTRRWPSRRDALREWSQRLRLPMALDDAQGQRIARVRVVRAPRGGDGGRSRPSSVRARRRPHAVACCARAARRGGPTRPGAAAGPAAAPAAGRAARPGLAGVPALGLVLSAGGAVRRGRGRRLPGGAPADAPARSAEAGRRGASAPARSHQRVDEDGRDEVAAVARSFNRAAARIEALVRSHQSLLANASHELRSPLARLKMAVSMLDGRAAGAARRAARARSTTNIAELDALVEEVLLASRLDAARRRSSAATPVDLLALAAEEAARVGASVDGDAVHGVAATSGCCAARCATCSRTRAATAAARSRSRVERRGGAAELRVCDRGPGVPEALPRAHLRAVLPPARARRARRRRRPRA